MVVCAAVDEGGIVGDVPSIASTSEATGGADLQRAGADGGRTGVGVVARKGQRAAGVFGERARATDDAGERLVTGARVDEVPAVCDGSRVAAASEAAGRSDFERAGVDGGASGI